MKKSWIYKINPKKGMQLQNQTSNPDLICVVTDNIVKYSNIIAEADKIPIVVYN